MISSYRISIGFYLVIFRSLVLLLVMTSFSCVLCTFPRLCSFCHFFFYWICFSSLWVPFYCYFPPHMSQHILLYAEHFRCLFVGTRYYYLVLFNVKFLFDFVFWADRVVSGFAPQTTSLQLLAVSELSPQLTSSVSLLLVSPSCWEAACEWTF